MPLESNDVRQSLAKGDESDGRRWKFACPTLPAFSMCVTVRRSLQ